MSDKAQDKTTRQHNAAVAAKREHAALIEERDQLATLCTAWRELAQARGRAIIAIAHKDHAAFDTAAKEAGSAANRLRKLNIPEEQLRGSVGPVEIAVVLGTGDDVGPASEERDGE